MTRPLLRAALAAPLVAACAHHAAPPAPPTDPFVAPPVHATATPVATPPAIAADARAEAKDAPPDGAPAAPPRAPAVPIDDAYARDVWLVDEPPLAVFLLSWMDDTSDAGAADCEATLRAHARRLGANRLWIDRRDAAKCRGGAYFVRDGAARGSAPIAGPLRAAPANDAERALVAWLRARWTPPPSLAEADARRLCVIVQFTVSPQQRINDVPRRPVRSSGDAAFDASVLAALTSAIDAHATVPDPPRDLMGRTITWRLAFPGGDDLRACAGPPR